MDLAHASGLHVLVGIPWEQHIAVLEEPGRAATVERLVREQVAACSLHPAVFALAVGNEIPAPIVRWSGRSRMERFLERLNGAAKATDPELLVTYVNYPTTEYLALPFLDFLAFNVYLESLPELRAYLARLHHRAGNRPLLMAELGADGGSHGPEGQGLMLQGQVRAALEGGCAGFFVFSWTDEWVRGGEPVRDWTFGLTTRRRYPKPALTAVRTAMEDHPVPPPGGWPSISVVVCAYQAEDTILQCLQGLARVDYPEFEVLLIDDGSTDRTADLVTQELPALRTSGLDIRVIHRPNGGLSRARNLGIQEARGEIVAFLDADAWPDESWLRHLAYAFSTDGHAGVGGPNIAPPGQGRIPACVANAPGGPVHVLQTDRVAEHVPGCNMAFRREALHHVDGFDPRFRVAGDDVDLCWRIQERGWTIGFSPGAMVWHHPRRTLSGFWKQQAGYGAAEALLEAKWPDKYNTIGHVTWVGRVYGPGTVALPWKKGRVYGGTWGQAPFQHDDCAPSSPLWEGSAMPEWYLATIVLGLVASLGLVWPSLLVVVPLLIAGVTIPVLRSVEGARRARFPGEQLTTPEILVRRGICGLLCLLQPLARLQGRFLRGLVPWRNRSRSGTFVWPRLRHLTFWRGAGDSPQVVLQVLEDRLAQRGSLVRRDSGWDDWDLEVEGGVGGRAQLRSCVEWHEGGQQLHRYAIVPKLTRPAMALPATGCFLAVWAAFGGNGAVALAFLGASALIGLRALWECGTASSALLSALESTFAAETFARDTAPEGRRTPVEAWHGASSPRTHESGGRSRLQAAG